jgi:flagella basal body P-ring formation protein FlgA
MRRPTSFAELGAATLALLLVAGPGAPPEGGLAEAVAARIAADWRVATGTIRLEWGRRGAPLETATPFELAGGGSGGWYAVLVDPEGEARALRVRAGRAETVMVAARPLERGHRIGPADLSPEVRVAWGPPGDDGAGAGEGWEVRRHLSRGEVVSWPAAAPPALVSGGRPVRLVWRRPGVELSMSGIALNSGRRGDVVRARVEGRKQRLRGTAIADGVVELTDGGPR